MAKDTEKLIRQLSLISYLMAERRPVTAPEIRRDVEGYSVMNEDAFARRFYADRSELEALGIVLAVEKPVDGLVEQENYSLPPENFHLPAIAFTDEELAALRHRAAAARRRVRLRRAAAAGPAADLLGPPEPAAAPRSSARSRSGSPASAGGHDVSQRLAKIETAIFRRKTIVFDYYTMERDEVGARRVDPYQLLYQGGQFYVVGRSHERDAIRVFRLSRIRGKVGYATKAEHDFQRPADFDPRALRQPDRLAVRRAGRAPPRCGSASASPGRSSATSAATARSARPPTTDRRPAASSPPYANARQLIAWVLGLGRERPDRRPAGARRRAARARRAARRAPHRRAGGRRPTRGRRRGRRRRRAEPPARRRRAEPRRRRRHGSRPDAAIRPERFARLVTLASILIEAGRAGRRAATPTSCARALKISDAGAARGHLGAQRRQLRRRHLRAVRRDPRPTARSRSTPSPTATRSRARPGCCPVEAKALIAAIDLIGEHIPEGSLASVREKVVAALGEDPVHEGLQFATPGRRRRRDRRRRLARDRRAGGCSRSSTTRRTRTSSPPGWSSPTR